MLPKPLQDGLFPWGAATPSGVPQAGMQEVMGAHPGGVLGAAAILVLGECCPVALMSREMGAKCPGRIQVMSPMNLESPGWILQSDTRLDTVWPLFGLGVTCPAAPQGAVPGSRTEPCLTLHGVQQGEEEVKLCSSLQWTLGVFSAPLKLGCFIYHFP